MPENHEDAEPSKLAVPAQTHDNTKLYSDELKLSRPLKIISSITWVLWVSAILTLLAQAWFGLQPGGDIAEPTRVAGIMFWVLIGVCVLIDVSWRLYYIRSENQGVQKLRNWALASYGYTLSATKAYTLARTYNMKGKGDDGNIFLMSKPVKVSPIKELAGDNKLLLRLLEQPDGTVALSYRAAADKKAYWAPVPDMQLRDLLQKHGKFADRIKANKDKVLVAFTTGSNPEPIVGGYDEEDIRYALTFTSEQAAQLWAYKERDQFEPENVTLARLDYDEYKGAFTNEMDALHPGWGTIIDYGSDDSITLQNPVIPLFFNSKIEWLEEQSETEEQTE